MAGHNKWSKVKHIKAKEDAKLAKTLGPGKKKQKLIGIPKLDDANDAGTARAA